MFILPLDSHQAVVCSGISFVFELLRILLAYLLARPSGEIRQLSMQKVGEHRWILWTAEHQHHLFVVHCLLNSSISLAHVGWSQWGIGYNQIYTCGICPAFIVVSENHQNWEENWNNSSRLCPQGATSKELFPFVSGGRLYRMWNLFLQTVCGDDQSAVGVAVDVFHKPAANISESGRNTVHFWTSIQAYFPVNIACVPEEHDISVVLSSVKVYLSDR